MSRHRTSRLAGSLAVLFGVWLIFAVPFVAVGANDNEDFYTGVASTKWAIDAVFSGAWPFWNMDSALGVPQPFRFHFITHPLSPLCRVADCARVLRAAAAVQVLVGAFFTILLVRRLTSDETASALAGVTFLFSSSIVQPTYIDDWATAAIPEATLPVLIYAAFALMRAERARDSLKWSMVLGGLAGFALSMFFPFAMLVATAVFILVQPRLALTRWRWLSLAAVIGVLICAGHVYHLAEQYSLTPADVERPNHIEPTFLIYLSSALLSAQQLGLTYSWRTIFFGGPFAIAAAVSFLTVRDRVLRAFKLALIVGLALIWVPESWFFDVMTHRWGYRSIVNLFGIVLAACALAQLRRARRPWSSIGLAVIALQLVSLGAAFWPYWRAVTSAWIEPPVFERSRRPRDEGITAAMTALHRQAPGRVALAPKAHDLTRRFVLVRSGLLPNQLQMAGVPSLYAEAHGITLDAIAPMEYTFMGTSPPSATTVTMPSTLNVLGIRYVIAMQDDEVSPGLRLIKTAAGGVGIFENTDAWPEAFFVSAFPTTPLPRYPQCEHDRFLCVDFSSGIDREPAPIEIERHPDGMTLRFAASAERRTIIVAQWYQPHWRVMSGSTRLVRAAEELIGLEIPPGEQTVTIVYLPVVRAVLFFVGILTEAAVFLVIAWLSLARSGNEKA